METTNRLFYSSTKFFTENEEEYRITATVSLDDDCHNNMCDWSITADIRQKNKYGRYKEYMGGCCHDEIAKHCPELAKFIPLHCCNHYGAPMYPVENGMYHIKNSDKSVAIEYLRISDKEYSKLSEAVDDKMYFKYLLFNLGIVDRWKRESGELIAELEDLCGKKWVNPYKPEEERFTLTLTDEERLLIEESIKAGYYSAENIEKRREEAHKAKMMEKRAEICEQYDKIIRNAETDKKVMLCVFDYGLSTDNVIYYNHTNTLSFNWRDYGEKITQEEFDDFVNNVDRSQLPEGIKFELMNKIIEDYKKIVAGNEAGKNICFMSRGEYADPKIAYNGILMNYWDVYDCMDEVEEPTDDDWLNAVSNLFDSYTYDVKNTDVDKFKMSDVMNVYRIINL